MKNNQTKYRVMWQMLPSILILLAVITILLSRFSVMGKQREWKEVENRMIATVQSYASNMEKALYGAWSSAGTVAAYIEEATVDKTNKQAAMAAVCKVSGIYDAAFINSDGTGSRLSGAEVELSEADYFKQICKGEKDYIYTQDDRLNGKPAIVLAFAVTEPSGVESYLVAYYDISEFESVLQRASMGINTFYMLSNTSGNIAAVTGNTESSLCERSSDYFSFLRKAGDNKAAVDRIYSYMQTGGAGISYISNEKESRGIIFAPVGGSGFYLLAVPEESYIDNAGKKEWSQTGSMLWQLVAAMLVFAGTVVVVNIISRIRENEKSRQLEDKADKDPLTDLYNKAATERSIREYLAEHPDEMGLMFVLDIDNFKKINDTMGHAFGDEVLHTLGLQIKAEFRATDIVGRTGGDEFTVFLRNMKEEAIIREEAKRIEQFFHNFQAGEYVKYSATASIGAAIYPKDATDFQGLYKAADHALYVAKKRGKNQLAFYGDEK